MFLEIGIILLVFKYVFDYLVKFFCLSYFLLWRDLFYIYWFFICICCLGGVIVGVIIGVFVVVGFLGFFVFFFYWWWKKNKEERKVEFEENGGENFVS